MWFFTAVALIIVAICIIFVLATGEKWSAMLTLIIVMVIYSLILVAFIPYNKECVWNLQTQQSVLLPNLQKIASTLNSSATMPDSLNIANFSQSTITSQAMLDYVKAVNEYNTDLRYEQYCRSYPPRLSVILFGPLPPLPENLKVIKL